MSSMQKHLPLLCALLVGAGFLIAGVTRSGVWDPYELGRAELARCLAAELFDARDLRMPEDGDACRPALGPEERRARAARSGVDVDRISAEARGPTLTDLGSGELGFTSMALGFRLFGLRDYAGRLPLALWALTGLLVLYAFVRRFASVRAALYASLALSSMPLYFLHARTMLGDAVTMAAFTAAACGLGGALLEQAGEGVRRAVWLALGVLGCTAAFLARGVVIGVAAPALAVGLAWLSLRLSVRRGLAFDLVGGGCLVVGIAALAVAWLRMAELSGVAEGTEHLRKLGFGRLAKVLDERLAERPVVRLLGFAFIARAPVESTFDLPIRDIGHALFPWSALLPFALGAVLRTRSADQGGAQRDSGLRVLLVTIVAVACFAFALVAPHAGALPFAAPAFCAALIGLALDDFDRVTGRWHLVALGALLFAGVLLVDFATTPTSAFAPFAVGERDLPKLFLDDARRYMVVGALGFAAVCVVGLAAAQPPAGVRAYARERLGSYRRAFAALSTLWRGNLAFAFLVVEAGLVGLGAMLFVGRRMEWPAVLKLPATFTRYGLNLWWQIPVALVVAPLLWDVARFAHAAALRRMHLPRSAGVVLGGLVVGAALCFGYYPALAEHLSPKEMFERYDRLHRPGEPLGVVGVSPRVARYYARGDDVVAHGNAAAAYRWLVADGAERRWLVVRASDLLDLNALHRRERHENLPVLDARSSQFLLVSNRLDGARNLSFLEDLVVPEPTSIQHPLDAMFGSELEVLGWEVRDERGALVTAVEPQEPYHVRFFYRVRQPITRAWKAFLHIDAAGRRQNGDHEVLGGRYRMGLWQPGDVVVDDYELSLDANFGPGAYRVYFGFFIGGERFAVTRGPHRDNRIDGGDLIVR